MKKYKILGIAAVSALMLTGCIDSMPEMTAEQSDMVAEYAAGLLLKYSPNYDYMLVSEGELKAALQQREIEAQMSSETPTAEETPTADQTKESKEPVEDDAAGTGNADAATKEGEAAAPVETAPEQQFADAASDLVAQLGLDEKVSLKYQSFEICDVYPKNATGFRGVEAAVGKKLLVIHFDAANDTNETVDCALYNYSIGVRAVVNDEIRARAKETPMLPNDMVSYEGQLKPGEKVDLTSIVEITEMSEEDISSIALSVSSSSGECAIKIK